MSRRKRIVILQGHPDRQGGHFCHALATAYQQGAQKAGHTVVVVTIAEHDIPFVRNQSSWDNDLLPPDLMPAQDAIGQADHLLMIYPLWLGTMPAIVKAFIEQVMRPGFALDAGGAGFPKPLLKGKSAHVVVTMGMPAFVYRWVYGAHSLKSLERNILKFCGFGPVRDSVIGGVGASTFDGAKWLDKLRDMGTKAL